MATIEEIKVILQEMEQKRVRKSQELTLIIPQVLSGVVYSLNHRDILYRNTPKPENFRSEDYYCNQKIVGNVFIDKEKTQQILENIFIGLEEERLPFMCLNYRHGLKVTFEDRVVDFIISFECDSMRFFDLDDFVECLAPLHTSSLFYQILHENEIPVIP